jgi:hypothetical protein
LGSTIISLKNYAFNANYSWNKLNLLGSTDPIIPAFNTPEHKFNIGFSGKDIQIKNVKGFAFNVNYKWIQGFLFEGSPQFTGTIPSYMLLDAQISWEWQKIYTTFKFGGSNLISKLNYQTYGGPAVGRMLYGSVLGKSGSGCAGKEKEETRAEFLILLRSSPPFVAGGYEYAEFIQQIDRNGHDGLRKHIGGWGDNSRLQ